MLFSSQTHHIDIPLRSIVRIVFVLLAVLFIFVIRDILASLLLGIIIASAIDPLATLVEQRGVPRIVSVLVIYLLGLSILVLGFVLLIPAIIEESSSLAQSIPGYYEFLSNELNRFGVSKDGVVSENVSRFLTEFSASLGSSITSFPGLLFSIFGGIFSLVSVFLISVYLALQRDGVERFLLLAVPPSGDSSYVVDLWERARRKIGRWFRGQLILAALIGGISWVGLTAIGVPYASLLALQAAILEIVPFVGPIAAGLTAVTVALFQSPVHALAVGAFYLLLQQLEGNVLVPIVFRRALGLHPIIVILAFMVGLKLGGIMGLILAVPIAAVLGEFFSDWSQGKVKL